MSSKGHPIFAFFYDKLTKSQERRLLGPIRRKLLGGLAGDIVDVGAGTGANLPYYGSKARVMAVEPDPHMRRRGVPKSSRAAVSWVAGGAEQLPLADASVDAVVFTLVLCTVGDVAQSLAEARRVLRPGGQLIFLEHVRSDRHYKLQERLNPIWRRVGAGCNLTRNTEAAIKAAGFAVTAIERFEAMPIMPIIYGTAR